MSAPREDTGGRAAARERGPRAEFAEVPLSDRPPRRRSATEPPRPTRLPRPPQGHGGFGSHDERATAPSSRPRRYKTTNAKRRIIASALDAADLRGYEALRISDITDPVGVQRQAFYAHFRDKRHCLCEAIDPKLGAIIELASGLQKDPPRWAEHVVGAVDEALRERFHSPEGIRARLISAMVELLRETGSLQAVRIGKLVRRAHVPTGDFYRQFSGKRECFAVAYEVIMAELLADLSSEFPSGDSASPRHRAPVLLRSLGARLASDPIRLRLLVVEAAHLPSLPSEEMAGAWRGSLAAALAELLGECEGVDGDDPALPMLAGSLIETIRSAVLADELDGLPERLVGVGSRLGMVVGDHLVASRIAA